MRQGASRGRVRQRPQRAIEAPLGRKLARRVRASWTCASGRPPASAASAASAASSPPRIAKRRPSPVIGSMKPAASPASSSPGTPLADASTRSGPRHDGTCDRSRVRETARKAGSERGCPQETASACARRRGSAVTTQALTRPAWQRRDADVSVAGGNASRRSSRQRRAFAWANTIEIGAHGPAPRPARMPGDAEQHERDASSRRRRQSRAALISRHLRPSRQTPRLRARARRQERRRTSTSSSTHAPAARAALTSASIETMAREDASLLTSARRSLPWLRVRSGPSRSCRRRATRRPRPRRGREPIENRHRAGIHGIAAELEAWKPRPIEHPHADAGARQHDGRDRPGRAGADDKDFAARRFTDSLARARWRCSSIRSRGSCTERGCAPRGRRWG